MQLDCDIILTDILFAWVLNNNNDNAAHLYSTYPQNQLGSYTLHTHTGGQAYAFFFMVDIKCAFMNTHSVLRGKKVKLLSYDFVVLDCCHVLLHF